MELGTRACPKHGSIFRSWGQMEFQSGNIAESRRVFERGLKACPTYARLYYAYGDVEASLVTERGAGLLQDGVFWGNRRDRREGGGEGVACFCFVEPISA